MVQVLQILPHGRQAQGTDTQYKVIAMAADGLTTLETISSHSIELVLPKYAGTGPLRVNWVSK